jgi:GT2 family glycosyltransferase
MRVKNNQKLKYVDFVDTFNYSKKVNLGAVHCSAEIILLLNDDMLAVSVDWESEMLKTFADETIGVVGALLVYPNGRIQHAGVNTQDSEVHHLYHHAKATESSFALLPPKYEVEAVTGAFMAIRKSVWDEIGGFNENFPVNFGDVEFCLNARLRGYRVVQNNRIIFTHLESATRRPGSNSFESHQLRILLNDSGSETKIVTPQSSRFSSVYSLNTFLRFLREHGAIETFITMSRVIGQRYNRR